MFGLGGFVAGIILIILGGMMVFFFPSADKYQPKEMTTMGVVIGFIFIIGGAVLVFL